MVIVYKLHINRVFMVVICNMYYRNKVRDGNTKLLISVYSEHIRRSDLSLTTAQPLLSAKFQTPTGSHAITRNKHTSKNTRSVSVVPLGKRDQKLIKATTSTEKAFYITCPARPVSPLFGPPHIWQTTAATNAGILSTMQERAP